MRLFLFLFTLPLVLASCDAAGDLGSDESTTVNEFDVAAERVVMTGPIDAGAVVAEGPIDLTGSLAASGPVEASGSITMTATPEITIGAVSGGPVAAGAVTATGPVELTGAVDLGPVDFGAVSAEVDLSISGGGLGVPVGNVAIVYVAPSGDPESGEADIAGACLGGILKAVEPIVFPVSFSVGFLAVIECP